MSYDALSLDEFKKIAKRYGAKITESDEDLLEDLNTILDEIVDECGIDIEPVKRKDIILLSDSVYKVNKYFDLDYRPITEICEITIDGVKADAPKFVLDEESGLLILKEPIRNKEILRVDYLTQVPESVIKLKVYPLVYLIKAYSLLPDHKKNTSELKEKDVSMKFSEGSNLYSIIEKKKDELKKLYAYAYRATMV